MLCDKADCNYYDSSMEYNCAWGNDGSSSIMCMTHDYKRYCQRPLTSKSGYVSGVNYKQLYESEKHLRELSEARFRAGEMLIDVLLDEGLELSRIEKMMATEAYELLHSTIAAYEAAVKGEGE